MGRPDDANPLHASLAAETVMRQHKQAKRGATEAGGPLVSLDRKVVHAMKPNQRIKWLQKALGQALDGRIQSSELYDVIAAKKFADGIEQKPGLRASRLLIDHLELFSPRQQRQLKEGAEILTKFKEDQDSDDDAPQSSAPKVDAEEDMMARIRDFVRTKAHERDVDPAKAKELEEAATPSEVQERAKRVAGMFKENREDEIGVLGRSKIKMDLPEGNKDAKNALDGDEGRQRSRSRSRNGKKKRGSRSQSSASRSRDRDLRAKDVRKRSPSRSSGSRSRRGRQSKAKAKDREVKSRKRRSASRNSRSRSRQRSSSQGKRHTKKKKKKERR